MRPPADYEQIPKAERRPEIDHCVGLVGQLLIVVLSFMAGALVMFVAGGY